VALRQEETALREYTDQWEEFWIAARLVAVLTSQLAQRSLDQRRCLDQTGSTGFLSWRSVRLRSDTAGDPTLSGSYEALVAGDQTSVRQAVIRSEARFPIACALREPRPGLWSLGVEELA
jgi:hypothetical protein